jgi:iron complex outermembrane receptor protein
VHFITFSKFSFFRQSNSHWIAFSRALAIFSLLISTHVFAQDTTKIHRDSLRVYKARTVEVAGDQQRGFIHERFGERVSTEKLQQFSAEPIIAEALPLLGNGIDVKKYGALGGVAFTSIHGLPAEYTVVYRDGIRITNEQNSLSDLGRTASYGIGSIEFFSPAANIELGGDAVGAAIDLIPRHAGTQSQFELGTSAVNYDLQNPVTEENYFAKADLGLGDRLGLSLTASNQHSAGNYPFLQDSTHTIQYRENNAAEVIDYAGTLDYAIARNDGDTSAHQKLTALFDYTTANRGAPGAATMLYRGASTFYANQYDEDLFSALKFDASSDSNLSLSSSVSYQTQYETYTDPQNQIADHYFNRILDAAIHASAEIMPKLKAFGGFDASRSYLFSNENYLSSHDSLVTRNRLSAYLALQTLAIPNLDVVGSLRAEAISQLQTEMLPQVSAIWHLTSEISAEAAWSAGYHAPTLNELYWKEGGNPNLQIETARNITAALRYILPAQSGYRVSGSVMYFRAGVDNEIVWLPGSQGFFTPTNILSVINQGLEFQAEMSMRLSEKYSLEASEDYTILSALNKTAGPEFFDKEIPYSTPTSSIFRTALHDVALGSLAFVAQYRGHRYTDLGNTDGSKLQPETTFDIVLSAEPIRLNAIALLVLQLACRNLSNKQYTEEPNYPLPGRSLRLTASLKLQPN